MELIGTESLVVVACSGCEKIHDGYCQIYPLPSRQWTRLGGCAARTHAKKVQSAPEFKINPLKASKRAMEVKK